MRSSLEFRCLFPAKLWTLQLSCGSDRLFCMLGEVITCLLVAFSSYSSGFRNFLVSQIVWLLCATISGITFAMPSSLHAKPSFEVGNVEAKDSFMRQMNLSLSSLLNCHSFHPRGFAVDFDLSLEDDLYSTGRGGT